MSCRSRSCSAETQPALLTLLCCTVLSPIQALHDVALATHPHMHLQLVTSHCSSPPCRPAAAVGDQAGAARVCCAAPRAD